MARLIRKGRSNTGKSLAPSEVIVPVLEVKILRELEMATAWGGGRRRAE